MTISLVMLIVSVTAMTAVVTRVDSETDAFQLAIPQQAESSTLGTLAASGPPSRCALQYAALLDLAQLARNDGIGSDTYRHALHKVSAKLNECQTEERHAAIAPGEEQGKDAQTQAYRRTYKQADKQAYKQAHSEANPQTHPQTYAQDAQAARNPVSPA